MVFTPRSSDKFKDTLRCHVCNEVIKVSDYLEHLFACYEAHKNDERDNPTDKEQNKGEE